jgi:hypothetical protein
MVSRRTALKAPAALSLLAHGWTSGGVGPAALASAGGAWQLGMQWLRHRDSGFAPGTQHLALAAAVGWFLGVAGAAVWLLATPLGR